MELIAIKQYNVLHSNSLEGLKEDQTPDGKIGELEDVAKEIN